MKQCDTCHEPFEPRQGGSPQRWCSSPCQKEGLKERRRKYEAIPKHRARVLLHGAKVGARLRGWEFDICFEDLLPIPLTCPVLGFPLDYGEKGKRMPNSPSIDRIDSSRGYAKGNVRIVSWRANDLKKNATVAELEAVLRDLKAHA
jgi:hypothetical protein